MNNAEHPERRQGKRIKKHFILTYFDVADPQTRHDASQLKDISLGGLCVITSKAFPEGTKLGIELKTPFLSDLTHLEGIVLFSQEKMKDIVYETHLKLETLSPQSEFILHKIIEHYKKEDTPHE